MSAHLGVMLKSLDPRLTIAVYEAAPDNTLAALLGASPGASASAHIALEIIQRCFPVHLRTPEGHARTKTMLPSFDVHLRPTTHRR